MAWPNVPRRDIDLHGVVPTPPQIVGFINRSVNDLLRKHFDGASITDEGVHLLDPFTGDGRFLTDLASRMPVDVWDRKVAEVEVVGFDVLPAAVCAAEGAGLGGVVREVDTFTLNPVTLEPVAGCGGLWGE